MVVRAKLASGGVALRHSGKRAPWFTGVIQYLHSEVQWLELMVNYESFISFFSLKTPNFVGATELKKVNN